MLHDVILKDCLLLNLNQQLQYQQQSHVHSGMGGSAWSHVVVVVVSERAPYVSYSFSTKMSQSSRGAIWNAIVSRQRYLFAIQFMASTPESRLHTRLWRC